MHIENPPRLILPHPLPGQPADCWNEYMADAKRVREANDSGDDEMLREADARWESYHAVSSVSRFIAWIDQQTKMIDRLSHLLKLSPIGRKCLDRDQHDTCALIRQAIKLADGFDIDRENDVFPVSDVSFARTLQVLDSLRVSALRALKQGGLIHDSRGNTGNKTHKRGRPKVVTDDEICSVYYEYKSVRPELKSKALYDAVALKISTGGGLKISGRTVQDAVNRNKGAIRTTTIADAQQSGLNPKRKSAQKKRR